MKNMRKHEKNMQNYKKIFVFIHVMSKRALRLFYEDYQIFKEI